MAKTAMKIKRRRQQLNSPQENIAVAEFVGRPHASVLRKYGMLQEYCFRELAYKGQIPKSGIKGLPG